ncbi:S8 family serine peptidase [Gottfriedia sp. NPDC056225]|uniref:S8 family serine peptidase n=1 Tax=Gottfriedia sp. NPDC056225 TaxID=3345751 RepID=UPI0035E30428
MDRKAIRKRFKKPLLNIMAVGMLCSLFQGNYSIVSAESSTTHKMLESLTTEQREALKQLDMSQSNGLEGFSASELNSNADISVIVEFRSEPEKVAVLKAALKGKKITTSQAKENVDQDHSTFQKDVNKLLPAVNSKSGKKSYKIMRSFKKAYSGVAMTLPANEVKKLLQSKAVKAVHKNATVTIEPPTKSEEGQGKEASLDSGAFLSVDKLHNEGYTGKGVKVAVIDTGIDYNHPDLKPAFKGGYDFVDNDNDPMETTYNDWKKSNQPQFNQSGSAYYTEHGTHVSGTIAAQAQNLNGPKVEGIAPDADLYVYRVLGPYGTGFEENIIAGIDQAVIDGMDVMNLSLGLQSNDPFSPTSTAINYAVLSGVVAVVSAGNSGPNAYTIGSPGAAALALTVGASSSPISVVKYSGKLNGVNTNYTLSNLYKDFTSELNVLNGKSLEIVDLGDGLEADYANKDVKGKVAFVNTGTIGTQSKVVLAKKYGASVVIAYSNRPNEGPSNFVREDQRFIPTFSMSYEEGLAMKDQLAAGKHTLTFQNYKETFTDGDKLASFSSRGPTRENYDMKPEVTAPGVSVMSTVPAYVTNPDDTSNYQFAYDRLSGTSMASPHVAGIAALLLQANPQLDPQDIKTILMNTAKPLDGTYSVFEVGAGRVDPYRAIHTNTTIGVQDETDIPFNGERVTLHEETGGLALGAHYGGEAQTLEKKVKINNQDNKKKTFILTTHFQKGVNGSLDAVQNKIKVTAPPVISVQGLKSKQVPISVSIPAKAQSGIYEGYFILTNQENSKESYRIPFSFRLLEDGFNTVNLLDYAISPPYLHVKRVYQSYSSTSLLVNFKAPMKELDLVLEDAKTGKEIGALGYVDVSSYYDGVNYLINDVFKGTYYAFTDDADHPVATQVSYAKPGLYRIKIIGTTERDQTFTNYQEVYIDNNGPTLTTSFDSNESPVIEYKEGQTTIPLQVKVTDKEVDEMTNAGMGINQSINAFNFSLNGNYNEPIRVGEDGNLDFTVPMNASVPFSKLNIYGTDAANNPSIKKNYYFVKEGTPYSFIKSSQVGVKMGEALNASLSLHNVKNMRSVEWTITNSESNLELVNAKLNENLSSYKNAKVTVESSGNTSKIKLDLNTTKGISDISDAINVKFKVKNSIFAASATMNVTASYTDEIGTQHTLSSAGADWIIQPTFSEMYGYLSAEGMALGFDWTKAGVKAQLIDSNGKKYDVASILSRSGDYNLTNLPLSDQLFTWSVKLPGHFSVSQPLPIGVLRNNEVWGQRLQYFTRYMIGGDVNQDDVIDIKDALALQKAWGSADRNSDIYFDGLVDKRDMELIVVNYLMQNPDAKNAPSPLEEKNGKKLVDVLKELGLSFEDFPQ